MHTGTTWQELDISSVADNQSTVYLRWTMGPTDDQYQYCGWNIDDVEIWAESCPEDCSGSVISSIINLE
ncbi:MAG: hypothetical protein LJE96_09785, partial [Deltaproteobacteria bacterium]|nr:hypothetical protein [Deltaproteobacteria bacterium]